METDSPAPPLRGVRAAKPLIILIGKNGQQKRELARRAAVAFPEQVVLVPTITNGAPRIGDAEGEFVHHPDFAIEEMETRGEFIECARRGRVFYGRTSALIVDALQDSIGIAVMSEEGALRISAAKMVVCYVVRIVTIEDDRFEEAPPTLSPAGLKVSLEIRCAQTEEGFTYALEMLRGTLGRITGGFQTTRPPPRTPSDPVKP